MKKESDSKITALIGSILNVRTWFDWDRMKWVSLSLVNGAKRLFVTREIKDMESFDEVAGKLDVNDAALLTKQKALFRLSMLMLAFAILILGYSGYQLFYGSLKAVLVSLVVCFIALVLAFRYHFWYYQIKSRKLGCTFNEWLRQGLLGDKK